MTPINNVMPHVGCMLVRHSAARKISQVIVDDYSSYQQNSYRNAISRNGRNSSLEFLYSHCDQDQHQNLISCCYSHVPPLSESKLVTWCLTALSTQIGYIVPQEYEIYHVGPEDKKKSRHKTTKQYSEARKSCALFGLGFMEMIPSTRLDFLRGVFLANHLASNDNSTRTTKRQNIVTYQLKLAIHKSNPNKYQQNITKLY